MSRKRERLEEMIAYESKLMEAYQLSGRLECELIERRMNHEFFFRLLCDAAGITNPVGLGRATIDAYIDQTKRLLKTIEGVRSTEIS